MRDADGDKGDSYIAAHLKTCSSILTNVVSHALWVQKRCPHRQTTQPQPHKGRLKRSSLFVLGKKYSNTRLQVSEKKSSVMSIVASSLSYKPTLKSASNGPVQAKRCHANTVWVYFVKPSHRHRDNLPAGVFRADTSNSFIRK